jgi:hypothetical protein
MSITSSAILHGMDRARVAEALHRLHIGAAEARLRREDEKKVDELAALLDEIARVPRRGLVVDAAAGKGTVGLLAAELVGVERLVVIERDPGRAAYVREAAERRVSANGATTKVEVREGDVGDPALWPEEPDLVVALHACGVASDAVLERAVAVRTRWPLLVPCCYARDVAATPVAETWAARLGADAHGEVRRRLVTALVDAERTLRLEAAGYETRVVSFVPPTVTPHHLLWRARRVGEPKRMEDAARRLAEAYRAR